MQYFCVLCGEPVSDEIQEPLLEKGVTIICARCGTSKEMLEKTASVMSSLMPEVINLEDTIQMLAEDGEDCDDAFISANATAPWQSLSDLLDINNQMADEAEQTFISIK